MTVDLQSPDVGNALAAFLDLRGQGRFPVALEPTIVPVVVVGNVEPDLRLGARPFMGALELAASVGNVGAYSLLNTTPAGSTPRDAYLEKLTIYTATTQLFRLSLTFPLPTSFSVPSQLRQSSQAAQISHAQLNSASIAVAGAIPATSSGFTFVVSGNVPFQLEFTQPVPIVIEPGGGLHLCGLTANLNTAVSMMWREEER